MILSMMQIQGLIYLMFIGTALAQNRKGLYTHYNLEKICPEDNNKKEVKLGTKAAVFTFNSKHQRNNFYCHLELEVPSTAYGFHVFFDEMYFLGSESSNSCEDYIQFARDEIFLTTYKSPLYCGHRALLNATNKDAFHQNYNGKQTRFYIEERDSEMDMWVKVKGTKNPWPRNLTLTVTVFKKKCSGSDRTFKKCPNSSYCVRKDFFCDSQTNCAWPNGDFPFDEADCDANGSSAFAPANIPIIIIVVIVVVAIILIFFIGMRSHCKKKTPKPPSNTLDSNEVGLLENREGQNGPPSAPPIQNEVQAEFSTPPAAPPTYQEAINHPPPYTEIDRIQRIKN